MSDYFSTQKNKQLAEVLKGISAWEHALRGWDVFDYSVSLEPAFRQIMTTPLRSLPVRDDAHISPDVRGRPIGAGRIERPVSTIPISPDAAQKAPQAFYQKQGLCEFQILLAEDMKFPPALTEQFFLSLSSCMTPIGFEIIADCEQTIIQMACDPSFEPDLKNQLNTFFPGTFISEVRNALTAHISGDTPTVVGDFGLSNSFTQPLQTFRTFDPDPLTGLLGSVSNLQRGERAVFQVLFQKCRHGWQEELQRILTNSNIKESNSPHQFRTKEKFSVPLFAVTIRVAVQSLTERQSWQIIRNIGGTLSQFSSPTGNELIALSNDGLPANNHLLSLINRTSYRTGMILNTAELSGIAHLPSVASSKLKRLKNDSKRAPEIAIGHEFVLGENQYMNETKTVSLSVAQRTRHLHILGGTGVGKSNLLLNLIKQDLKHNDGLCVIDPHGDLIDAVVENIPESRMNDVVLFDPADSEYPIGFNILHAESELEKTLLASDLVATFRRFSTSWGDVMDSVLANAILAFVESTRGGTLFELKRFLVEKDFRNDFLQTVTDEAIIYFWRNEFPVLSGKPQSSILIRLDTFLRQKLIRNIVCQKSQTLNFRQIMDSSKILLFKLPHGLIGEENSYLLGTLLIAKLQQTALSRQNIEADQRRFFSIYADEFHHFITPSMATLLSGIRKYGVGLTLAHQSFRQIAQRDADVASSVLTNCGTRICFRLGDTDAEKFARGFSFFDADALQNLGVGDAIVRIDRAEYDFNLKTTLVTKVEDNLRETRKAEAVRIARAGYARPRSEVEAESIASRPPPRVERAVGESQGEERPVSVPKKDVRPLEQTAKTNTEEVATAVKPPIHTIPKSDRGDGQHRYLQSLVKKMAESKGFRVTLEKPIFGGVGRIDVALEDETHKIACEISVTNEPDYEVQNIQKCLSASFCPVIMISADKKHLSKIRQKAHQDISPEDCAKTEFFSPEEFYAWLEGIDVADSASGEKIKGFKVKVNLKPSESAEQTTRKKAISDVVFGAMKRMKNKNNDT